MSIYQSHLKLLQENRSVSSHPQILKYHDPVEYLNDYYHYKKYMNPEFSYEQWAQESGTSTRSHMRLVSTGKRRITDHFVKEYCRYNNLTAQEEKHFYLISYYTDAKEKIIKATLFNTILEQHDLNHQEVDADLYKKFLEKSVHGTIQVLLGFNDVELTTKDLSHVLGLEQKVIEDSLRLLLEIGFAEEFEKFNGQKIWKSKVRPLKVSDSISHSLTKFHYQNLKESAEQVLEPREGSRCRSVMMSIGSEHHEDLKNDIEDFLRKIKAKYSSDEINNKEIFKINLHAFPLTKMNKL